MCVDILNFCVFVFLLADTGAERQALRENVYPKLREFCRENYGLEFQVMSILVSLLIMSAESMFLVITCL